MDRRREPLPTRVQDTPDLPAAYRRRPRRRACATSAIDLPPDARATIEGHVRLLLAWTPAINLTAIREPAAVARATSSTACAAVPWLRSRGTGRLLDLGSGGGFPGLPLAAALPALEMVAARADRQEGPFPAHGRRGDRARRPGRRDRGTRRGSSAGTPASVVAGPS